MDIGKAQGLPFSLGSFWFLSVLPICVKYLLLSPTKKSVYSEISRKLQAIDSCMFHYAEQVKQLLWALKFPNNMMLKWHDAKISQTDVLSVSDVPDMLLINKPKPLETFRISPSSGQY